jgi:hypothetical protein
MAEDVKQGAGDLHIHLEGQRLLLVVQSRIEGLESLLKKVDSHWEGEDAFYRFYHGSMKVYWLQKNTEAIVSEFQTIGKEAGLTPLNTVFMGIVHEGTGKAFDLSHNHEWEKNTRPILEAFFHAREMLRQMVKYGRELEYAPNSLPSGWATVLYLYKIR